MDMNKTAPVACTPHDRDTVSAHSGGIHHGLLRTWTVSPRVCLQPDVELQRLVFFSYGRVYTGTKAAQRPKHVAVSRRIAQGSNEAATSQQ